MSTDSTTAQAQTPAKSFSTPLDGALWAVSKGFYVAPVTKDARFPPLVRWAQASSNRLADVHTWAARFPGCNWLIDCGKSGITVIDVDIKKGKRGDDTILLLQIEHDTLPPTLRARTTTGGGHIIYTGEAASTVEALGPGVDTRGIGGYIICPGSIVDGRPYEILDDLPLAGLPSWISEALASRTHAARKEQTPVVDLDLESSIQAATRFLEAAEPAVEGAGGDARTLSVAAKLKDYGLTEATALELLLDHYNDRCSPPWSPEELELKVANAWAYCRQNKPGELSGEALFGDATEEEIPGAEGTKGQPVDATKKPPEEISNWDGWVPSVVFERRHIRAEGGAQEEGLCGFRRLSNLKGSDLQRLEGIVADRYYPGFLHVIQAPGGTGKSAHTNTAACAIASGRSDLIGPVLHPGPVLIYNSEDPYCVLENRLHTTAEKLNVPQEARENFVYASGQDVPIVYAALDDRGTVMVNERLILQHVEMFKTLGIKAAFLDPLVRLHRCNENSNDQMEIVARMFTFLARKTGAAVVVIHHTNKAAATKSGDPEAMEAGRGASSVPAGARVTYNLITMSKKEAKEQGIPEDDRTYYVRLFCSKNNLGRKAPPKWFRLSSAKDAAGGSVPLAMPSALEMVGEPEADEDGFLVDRLMDLVVEAVAESPGVYTKGTLAAAKSKEWSETEAKKVSKPMIEAAVVRCLDEETIKITSRMGGDRREHDYLTLAG